jgi:hypothetical protein
MPRMKRRPAAAERSDRSNWCVDHRMPAVRAREHLSVKPRRYRSGRVGRQHENATRFVRKERPDGGPFKVSQFIPHDSRFRFGRLNRVQTDAFNRQTRTSRTSEISREPDMPPTRQHRRDWTHSRTRRNLNEVAGPSELLSASDEVKPRRAA